MRSGGFSENWETYLTGMLRPKVIKFLKTELRSHGISNPTIQDILSIPYERIVDSSLSFEMSKELLIFQERICRLANHQKSKDVK